MKAHFIKHWNLLIPEVTITQICRFVKEETSTDGSKQSIGEGWSLIVVGHPSLENGWDIPHSQILGWHRGTACNEVWRGGCPDGEMTWGGTRQTNRHTDRWMGRGWGYTTSINKNKVLHTKKRVQWHTLHTQITAVDLYLIKLVFLSPVFTFYYVWKWFNWLFK